MFKRMMFLGLAAMAATLGMANAQENLTLTLNLEKIHALEVKDELLGPSAEIYHTWQLRQEQPVGHIVEDENLKKYATQGWGGASPTSVVSMDEDDVVKLNGAYRLWLEETISVQNLAEGENRSFLLVIDWWEMDHKSHTEQVKKVYSDETLAKVHKALETAGSFDLIDLLEDAGAAVSPPGTGSWLKWDKAVEALANAARAAFDDEYLNRHVLRLQIRKKGGQLQWQVYLKPKLPDMPEGHSTGWEPVASEDDDKDSWGDRGNSL